MCMSTRRDLEEHRLGSPSPSVPRRSRTSSLSPLATPVLPCVCLSCRPPVLCANPSSRFKSAQEQNSTSGSRHRAHDPWRSCKRTSFPGTHPICSQVLTIPSQDGYTQLARAYVCKGQSRIMPARSLLFSVLRKAAARIASGNKQPSGCPVPNAGRNKPHSHCPLLHTRRAPLPRAPRPVRREYALILPRL